MRPADFCPHCGQETTETVTRAGLTFTTQPRGVFWKGVRVRLSPALILIMEPLIRRGRVSHAYLEMIATDASDARCAIKVQMCILRKRLQEAGVPHTIELERGIGYRLDIHPEPVADVA